MHCVIADTWRIGPATEEGREDVQWMQYGIWGKFGYETAIGAR